MGFEESRGGRGRGRGRGRRRTSSAVGSRDEDDLGGAWGVMAWQCQQVR